ncbi:MAG TPA: cytochrome c [Bryobacteraceae bacterium]|jgi:hypothetical protein|nr:cytochrome c [Bryobacteraceae bacterium]
MNKARFFLAFGVTLALSGPSMAAELTSAPKTVTYTKDVAPIFQEKCESCHRPGTNAPMSLRTWQEARPWAKSIKARVVTQNMPPWHLDKTVGIQDFSNDRSLSDAQIATVVKWVDGGALQGDPKDMPVAKVWPSEDGWMLAKQFGEPDLVIKSDDYTMYAHGQDVWWKPVSVIPLTEARWVRAVELRPTAAGRKITHHSVASLHQTDPDAKTDSADDDDPGAAANPGGILMEWAIGKNYDTYRPGSGKLLLPGAEIRWDIHYHASGEQVTDHSELAVYLYPKGQEPKYKTVLTNFGATNRADGGLDIPPNSIKVTQGYHVLKSAARLENFQPHMHLRGKAMSMEAILPDGTVRLLSYVDKFNFNWMNNYIYTDEAAPVLPKGTVIHITAWHDNTTANPNNPDPDQWVGQGDRTVDEMAHAWVNVTYISDQDYKDWLAAHKPARAVTSRRGQ